MQKRTKIVATLSNLRCSPEFVKDLLQAGVNVFRLNTAHQTPEEMAQVIDLLRDVAPHAGVLIDTKGPEIRTSKRGEPVQAVVGQPIYVSGDPDGESRADQLFLTHEGIVEEVPLGSSLLVDDGELELVVTAKENGRLTCFPQSDGTIKNRKSVNVPNVEIDQPALSARDKEFLRVAAEHKVDFVAHSFVRTREDVMEVLDYMEEIGLKAAVIAKIENQQGVDNIDQILDYAYGIMVARGDLGIEIPGERVPQVQQMIVHKCIESKKPVIIATQMLHSMIENPRPTRAEISDVANAIQQRSDAVMLSGETAYGKYPVEAVRTMARIAAEAERHQPPAPDQRLHRVKKPITETLARAAVRACAVLPVRAIVVDTLTGRTARYLAAFRGQVPIFAMCYAPEVMRLLSLSYGVEPSVMRIRTTRDDFLSESLSSLVDREKISHTDLILIVGGSFGPSYGASFMEIGQAENILKRPHL